MRKLHKSISLNIKSQFAISSSTLALGLALAASPATAQQVVVGSPQCPIVDGVAVCEGNLSTGVSSQQRFGHAPVRRINVTNSTTPIAPANGIFGIGIDRSDGDLNLNVANGVVIDVFDNPAIVEPAQGIVVLLRGGRSLVIDSGATITSNSGGRGAGGPGAGIEGDLFGAGGGSLTIANRGQITTNSTTDRSVAIAGQLFEGATGNITINNAGALFVNSSATGERDNIIAGILGIDTATATSSNGINVNNNGAITVRTNAGSFDSNFVGVAAGIVTNVLSGNGKTAISNSGAIDVQGPSTYGIVGYARGNTSTSESGVIIVNTAAIRVDGIGSGILAQSAGEKVDLQVRNTSGPITLLNANSNNTGIATGIWMAAQSRTGTLSIENLATITSSGTSASRGIAMITGGAPANGNYNMSVVNSGNITLGTPQGQGIRVDATRDDTVTATINNSGAINLSSTTNATSGGIVVNFAGAGTGDGVTSATLTNSGAITMGSGVGMFVAADTITVTNSGAINTSNATSDAVNLSGTGTGAINFTTTGAIRARGVDSDAIAIYGTASSAAINLNGAAIQAPTGIANSQNYAIRVAGDISTTLNATNGAVITGNLLFAGGNDTINLATGTRLVGNVATGAGNDTVALTSGTFSGALDLGAGDDTLNITNFALADLAAIAAVEGGIGTDTINFRVRDGDALAFSVAGLNITNIETFGQLGLATVTLTGTNTAFPSTYELRQGTLNQNAVLANTNLVTSASTILAMSGSVRNLTVAGDFLPGGGATTGSATVGGNFTLASTGTYFVDIQAAGASDLVSVTGTATLAGGRVSVNSLSPDSAFGTRTSYTILSAAGGLTGTFGSLVNEDLPFLNLTLTYSPTSAILNVSRAMVEAAKLATTFNQTQVAGVFDSTQLTATGDYRLVIDALTFSTTPQVLTALNTNSGELHASLLAIGARQTQIITNAMEARTQSRSNAGTTIGAEGRFSLWASAGAADGSIDADGNASSVSGTKSGLLVGGEWVNTTGQYVLGIAAGNARTNVDISALGSSAKIDGWQYGAYGRIGSGAKGFTLSGMGSWAGGDASTSRAILVNSISRNATADYKVETYSLSAQARYGLPSTNSEWTIGPVASISTSRVARDAFTETGAASLSLIGQSDSETYRPYSVGGFVNWQGAKGKFDLAVQYENGGGKSTATQLTLQGAPSTPFLVRSPTTNESGVRVDLSGEFLLGSNWAIGAGYRGRFGDNNQDHSAMISLIWRP
jgi:uncharacterized protein with beta-barrel porin domain